MLLLVGLGNPGSRYAGNRHNIGFMVVEAIAKSSDADFGQCYPLEGNGPALSRRAADWN